MRSNSLDSAIKTGDLIRESAPILDVGNAIFKSSWKRFKAQFSTKYCFTESTILELLETNHTDKLATFDKVFTSEGNIRAVN